MKAAIVVRPGDLVVRDIPLPTMGDYDALCRMEFGATCSGTDTHLIEGRFPWPVNYPTVLGHESVGRVVSVGSKVRHLHVGDLVSRVGAVADPGGAFDVNWGGFVEFGLARDHRAAREDGVPAGEWSGCRIHQVIPPDIDPRAATMIITWRETLSYLTRLGVAPGTSVLVLGSGGNGLSFVAHAAHMCAGLIAQVGSSSREAVGRAAGASVYLDYRAANLEALLRQANVAGFDVMVDAVGKTGMLDAALPALADQGTLGIYGVDDFGRCSINPTRARGSFRYYQGGYDEEETHDRVIELIRSGALRSELWLDLDAPFGLDDIGEAFRAVSERRCVKALVRLSDVA